MSDSHEIVNPLVSVILPVRNGERWLESALSSLFSQTFNDFEIVLINDGSTDNSVAIAHSMKSPRIRVIDGPSEGLARALALGVEEATGQYIARLDVDDIAEPRRFEVQLEAFRSDSELVIVGSAATEIDETGRTIGQIKVPLSDQAIRMRSMIFNPFVHSSVMMKRKELIAAGNYRSPTAQPYPEDFDLWVRLLRFGKAMNLNSNLIQYRRSQDGVMSVSQEQIRIATARLCIAAATYEARKTRMSIREAELLSFFHWRTRRIKAAEVTKVIRVLLCIRKSSGLGIGRGAFSPATYFKPIFWMMKSGSQFQAISEENQNA